MHEVMGLSQTKAIDDVALVPHLNKSLAQFNKKPFHQKFSHRNGDYKLA